MLQFLLNTLLWTQVQLCAQKIIIWLYLAYFPGRKYFFYLIYYQVFIIVVLKLLKDEDEEEIAVSKLVTTSYRFISKLQRSFNPSQHWVRSCSAKDNQDFSVDSLYCNLVSSWDTKCFNAKYLRKWVYRLVTLWRVKITEALTNCH